MNPIPNSRTQLIDVLLAWIETNTHRHALDYLHVVAGGVLGSSTRSRASNGRHAFNGSRKVLMYRIHMYFDALPGTHVFELCLLEIGGNPQVLCLGDHQELFTR